MLMQSFETTLDTSWIKNIYIHNSLSFAWFYFFLLIFQFLCIGSSVVLTGPSGLPWLSSPCEYQAVEKRRLLQWKVNLICAMRLMSSFINFNLSTHCFLAYLLSMKGNFDVVIRGLSGFSNVSVQPVRPLCVVLPLHDDLVNFGRACVCAHAPRWPIRPFTLCSRATVGHAAGLLFV